MDPRLFHKRLFDACDALLPADSKIVSAVSGGIDSTALLHGLAAVNEIHARRWTLHVAHLDHHHRPGSAQDAAFVRRQAEHLKLEITIGDADVPALAQERGESIEEAGRRARYEFLADCAFHVDAKFVAVAHHADDQAETILHRIARGTGLRGLAGMAVSRPIVEGSLIDLVRPLLGFARDELAAYLSTRGIPHCHDSTNEDIDVATRNRIRHHLLPLLRDFVNPNITVALTRLAEHARRAQDAVTFLTREAMRRLHVDESDGQITLPAGALREWPTAVQGEIIVLLLDRLGIARQEIGFERIEAILELLSGDGRKRHIELPGGVIVMRQGRRLTIRVVTSSQIQNNANRAESPQGANS